MPLQQLLASPAWGSLLVSDPPTDGQIAPYTCLLMQGTFCAKCTVTQDSGLGCHRLTAQRVISYICANITVDYMDQHCNAMLSGIAVFAYKLSV